MYIVYICVCVYIYIYIYIYIYRERERERFWYVEHNRDTAFLYACNTHAWPNFKNEETSEENILRGNLQHYQSVVYKKINTVKKQELKNDYKLNGTKMLNFL